MSAPRGSSMFRKHTLHGRTAKILALVPIQHAPSDTSDRSDMDNELANLHTPSLASSSAPSLDSSLERMHILSSPEPDAEDLDTGDDPPEFDFTETSLQLTPVLRQICPATPTREPNYENIPSLSSIPSLPSEAPLSTPESATRKTRAQRHITPVLAKRKRKFRNLY
ncbi:hypothetical protein KGM_208420 [Danaus plexippus plexippus]|uniref:Uncharacterized protein n=1 Tax=Danaus plexippus plexippus TaxID=278856 RepID=A0A212FKT2_DANPL|nr:hypothetical protein KGM_208420 [Danaus plexippus plexippus]